MVWINYVLIAVIVIIIVFLLLWSRFNTAPSVATQTSRGLQSPCVNNDGCAAGLVCDLSFNECKVAPGGKCDSFSSCSAGFYCSGVCVSGAYGQVRQNCPCFNNLVCLQEGDRKLCKALAGTPCNADNQCVSNYCQSGVCAVGIADGLPCNSDSQCLSSSHCDSFGFCQPQSITSGQVGAACQTNEPPPAISVTGFLLPHIKERKKEITSQQAAAAGCNIGNVCINDHCAIASAGLGSACGDRLTCVPPMVCVTSSNSSVGSCSYNQNVNSCPSNICASGFACNNALCYANTGQACAVVADCKSGTCAAQASIFYLTGGLLQNTNPQWTPITPPPNVTVKRMLGVPLSSTSTQLYLVTSGGLYQTVFGSGVQGNWILSLSGNTLVDASVSGGSIFLLIISNGTQNALFTYNAQTNTTAPFNTATGIQVDNKGNTLMPTSIDVSSNNAVAITSGNEIYTLSANVFLPLLTRTPTISKPRWYYLPSNVTPTNTDVAYLTGYSGVFLTGAAAGLVYPTDRASGTDTFSIIDYSVAPNGNMAIIATSATTGASNYYVIINGTQYILPGFAGTNSRILSTNNGIWTYSTNTCS